MPPKGKQSRRVEGNPGFTTSKIHHHKSLASLSRYATGLGHGSVEEDSALIRLDRDIKVEIRKYYFENVILGLVSS